MAEAGKVNDDRPMTFVFAAEIEDAAKFCNKCKVSKPLSKFYIRKSSKRSGQINPQCIPCARETARKYYLRTREKRIETARLYRLRNPNKRREYYRKNRNEISEKTSSRKRKEKYGINDQDFKRLIEIQDGRCLVCKRRFSKLALVPVIDHCHQTGLIRGILCHPCNTAEGLLKTPKVARALFQYMEQNELLSYAI